MQIVVLVARVLLGLMFTVLGLNGFLYFLPAPSTVPADAAAFAGAMAHSHYAYVTSGVQVACGLLLLLNQYVPFALIVLAAVLVNIFTFHITMWPAAIFPLPVIALVLWFIVAWPLRRHFALLFARRV